MELKIFDIALGLYFLLNLGHLQLHYSNTNTTGASHASHLGNCCSSAYSSRVSYVKKRQVWKFWSKTDWPHLQIMPDFSTEKNRSPLILTATCWQEISLSNTVELTTVIPQKYKICHSKHCFLPVFENSRGSIVCLHAANPVMHHDWVVLFSCTSAGCQPETGTYVKTKPPNHGASQDLLHVSRQWNLWNFRKPAKTTFGVANLLLLWNDSSQFNGVWKRNLLSTCGC